MPHFIIEYSRNLEARLDLQVLAQQLRDEAVATGVFPLAGIRVRLYPSDIVAIADDDPNYAFMHVQLRVGSGREESVLATAGERLFAVLSTALSAVQAPCCPALSFEIDEIHPQLTWKQNPIRQYMADRDSSA